MTTHVLLWFVWLLMLAVAVYGALLLLTGNMTVSDPMMIAVITCCIGEGVLLVYLTNGEV